MKQNLSFWNILNLYNCIDQAFLEQPEGRISFLKTPVWNGKDDATVFQDNQTTVILQLEQWWS